jgi:hypothetical protein
MRRRQLLIGLGVLAASFEVSAQQPSEVRRIGFLYFGSRVSATGRYEAFILAVR